MRARDLLMSLVAGDTGADRVVPPAGFTARLTVFTAGAMAFLAVFALALTLAADRLADRWAESLARSATVRIAAPVDGSAPPVEAALTILRTTPGVATARALPPEETGALLVPWLGPDLPLDSLPVPTLIEVVETEAGIDAAGLQARLDGEAPGAVYDDHGRWRAPMTRAAERLQSLGGLALALIAAAAAAMIALAAQAALAANAQVISALRLVGALDSWIARAFVRRFTLRALAGSMAGTVLGGIALATLPGTGAGDGLPIGLGPSGAEWLWLLPIPPVAALLAFGATRTAAFRQLRETT